MTTTKRHLIALVLVGAVALPLTTCDEATDCEKNPGAYGCECSLDDKSQSCSLGLICDPVVETCRLPLNCASLLCQPNQLCGLADNGEAECKKACEAGYEWDEVGEKCALHPATCASGLPHSIDLECAAQLRVCEQPLHDEAAWCGDCVEGYVDSAGACREKRTCDDVESDCQKQQRMCIEGEPNEDAYCALECAPGAKAGAENICMCTEFYAMNMDDPAAFVCEPVARCPLADGSCPKGFACVSCTSEEACVKAVGDTAAYCKPKTCDGPYLWSDVLQECVECPKCAAMGTGATGKTMLTDDQTQCLCETKPGYFFTFAGEIGVYACDKDQDGWVRESARSSVESDDAVMRAQARCKVGRIDAILLVNDFGQKKIENLPGKGLKLYETDRNDDDALLAKYLLDAGLNKGYGSQDTTKWLNPDEQGLARAKAGQLNRFTRLCHLPTADYNDNGDADVLEWQTKKVDNPPIVDQALFNKYSYFAELHSGSFGVWEDGSKTFSAQATSGPVTFANDSLPSGKAYVWAIVEQDRASAGSVPLQGVNGQAAPKCYRRPDATATQYYSKASMDFLYSEPDWSAGWTGMTHTSQFKCVLLQNEASSTAQNGMQVNFDANRWAVNQCSLNAASGTGQQLVDLGNCSKQASGKVGQVRWAVAEFQPYFQDLEEDGYIRGCVDQCAELRMAAMRNNTGFASSELGHLPFSNNGTPPCNLSVGHKQGIACTVVPVTGLVQCGESCTDSVDNDGDSTINELPQDVYGKLANPGATNDGNLITGQAKCSTGLAGTCAAGKIACNDKTGWPECKASVGIDGTDYCNGKDDDCDGEVDEDAATSPALAPGQPYNNQKAGDSCSHKLVGACAGKGGTWGCDSDKGIMNCVANSGAVPQDKEQCNGIDEDCDGIADDKETQLYSTDSKLGLGKKCGMESGAMVGPAFEGSAPQGECAKNGQQKCTSSGWRCEQKVTATTEKCNGRDDDCNGIIDDWQGNKIKGAACRCKSYHGALGYGGYLYVSGKSAPGDSGSFVQLNKNCTFKDQDMTHLIAGSYPGFGDHETKWSPMEHVMDVKVEPPASITNFDNITMGLGFTFETLERKENDNNFEGYHNTFFQWDCSVPAQNLKSNVQAAGSSGSWFDGKAWHSYSYQFQGEDAGVRACVDVINELKAAGVNPAQTTVALQPGTTTAGAPANTYRLHVVHRIWGETDGNLHKDTGWIRDRIQEAAFDLTGSSSSGTVRRGFDFVTGTAGGGHIHQTHWRIPAYDSAVGSLGLSVNDQYHELKPIPHPYCAPGYGENNAAYPYGIFHYIQAVPGDKDFYQRVIVRPGWGRDGWDNKATTVRTWIRVPWQFTPPDAL